VDAGESLIRHTVRGALLGAACGDAVGAPFEDVANVSRTLVTSWMSSDVPLRYTHDTAMTLVLARHLLSTAGAIDEDRLVREFAHEWQSDTTRGYGAAPPKIFRAVLAGAHWSTIASSAFGGTGSWGNGGAMRVTPVALLPQPIGERIAKARRQASVTHAHPLAQDGAALQCAAIAQAAESTGRPLREAAFVAAIIEHVTTSEFGDALACLVALVRLRASPEVIAARLGSDVTALGSVPTAIALFLRSPEDLETALISAAVAGGDTDTIASMVGALAGARSGQEGVPNGLVRRLESYEGIIALADQLPGLAGP
jgi:poly(ADP-ribose) glycohydrolase ARH3